MPASLTVAIFFLIGLSAGLARSALARWAGLLVGAGPLILSAVNIFLDITRDPTSHNLFPFELAGAFVVGLTPAAAGVLCGYLAAKSFPVPPRAKWLPVGAAAVLIVFSPMISRRVEQQGDHRAMDTLRRLWASEQSYATRDPGHRFTCDGPALTGFEHRQWFAWTQLGLTTKDHMSEAGNYYQLGCGPLSRGDDLLIRARTANGREYCIGRAGVVTSGTSTAPCRPDAGFH